MIAAKAVRTVFSRNFSSVVRKQKRIEADFITIAGQKYPTDEWTNITPFIQSLTARQLCVQPNNPLQIVSESIHNYFEGFDCFEFPSPVVQVNDNFDSLLVSKDHVSRQKHDTYYVNNKHVLRSHTSAHQVHCLQKGSNAFFCIADVYRRDAINSTHFPCFHQCEVFKLFSNSDLNVDSVFKSEASVRSEECQELYTRESSKRIEHELKLTVEGYIRSFLGKETKIRWVSAYFPFTHPSFEMEIFHNGDWIEIMGSGVVEHKILSNNKITDKIGWAFGLGLERLAMIKYAIPDIRLFWTKDTGFYSQFKNVSHTDVVRYKPISKFPQLIQDISFWLPDSDDFWDTDFYDIVHSVSKGLIEQVELIDDYTNKEGRRSLCYRIIYRSHDRTLTHKEVNEIHANIGLQCSLYLNVEIRH